MARNLKEIVFWITIAVSILSALGTMHKLMDKLKGGKAGGREGGPPIVPPRPGGAVSGVNWEGSSPGKRLVGYFPNWGIYAKHFLPSSIPVHDLTHICYAFASISTSSGTITLSDAWADVEIRHPDFSGSDGGLAGNFGSLARMKRQHRHLKLLLSVGGWSYRDQWACLVGEDGGAKSRRQGFVQSAVRLVEDLGLDGIDLDWEFPANDREASALLALVRDLRSALDAHGASTSSGRRRFELTIAAPCGVEERDRMRLREMDAYVDAWHLMAYDFSGSWDATANHAANLFGGGSGGICADSAVQAYLSKGIQPDKIVLGVPAYGKRFFGSEGLGTAHDQQASSGDAGNVDYKELPLPGSQLFSDDARGADYSYDPHQRILVSQETPRTAALKAQYIIDRGLGGAMFWDLTMDHAVGGPREHERLIRVFAERLGGSGGQGLHARQNVIDFPQSKFANLAQGQM